jgi:hypothetical protein
LATGKLTLEHVISRNTQYTQANPKKAAETLPFSCIFRGGDSPVQRFGLRDCYMTVPVHNMPFTKNSAVHPPESGYLPGFGKLTCQL